MTKKQVAVAEELKAALLKAKREDVMLVFATVEGKPITFMLNKYGLEDFLKTTGLSEDEIMTYPTEITEVVNF